MSTQSATKELATWRNNTSTLEKIKKSKSNEDAQNTSKDICIEKSSKR